MYKKIFISTSVQLMSYLLYHKYQQSEFRVLAYGYCIHVPARGFPKKAKRFLGVRVWERWYVSTKKQ